MIVYEAKTEQSDVLCHYGVLGMRWGIRRARKKTAAIPGLERKALKYDAKAASLNRKAERAHGKYDMDVSNMIAEKAAKTYKKAVKYERKALNAKNDIDRDAYKSKAANLKYKSAVQQLSADQVAKTTGYGEKAMKYSTKSREFTIKAEKARAKIASNQSYINTMNRKVNSLTGEELERAKKWLGE